MLHHLLQLDRILAGETGKLVANTKRNTLCSRNLVCMFSELDSFRRCPLSVRRVRILRGFGGGSLVDAELNNLSFYRRVRLCPDRSSKDEEACEKCRLQFAMKSHARIRTELGELRQQ